MYTGLFTDKIIIYIWGYDSINYPSINGEGLILMDSRALVFRYAGVTQNAFSAGSPTTCIRYCNPWGEYFCPITLLILWQPSESDDRSHTITYVGFTWLPSRYRIGGCLCLWGRVFESHVWFCNWMDSVWQLCSLWAIWRDETTLKKSDGVGSLTLGWCEQCCQICC